MPKQRFYNIPEEKRNLFLEISFKEFSIHPYDVASITNIVKVMQIAKGSVYQYFENKKDLYFFLLSQSKEAKENFIQSLIKKKGPDFWKWYKKYIEAEILFYVSFPVAGSLILSNQFEINNPDLGNQHLMQLQERNNFFENQLKKFVKKGNVAKKNNIQKQANILSMLSTSVVHQFFAEHNINLREVVLSGEKINIKEKQIKAFVTDHCDSISSFILTK